MVDGLREKVFFVWGTLCAVAGIYAYMLIPETKGLTLEQVDRMLEESTPRNSSKWVPNSGNMYSVRKNRASVDETTNHEESREEKEVGDKKASSG